MASDYFHGYALNGVDAKNRLSIPSAFRDVIRARSASQAFLLAPHETAPCLVGYDQSHSARLHDMVEKRFSGQYGMERDDFVRRLFGSTESLNFDDSGRMILSVTLKELGEIDRVAFFIGAGDYFEIWNPQLLLELKGSDPRLARIVRKQLELRGEAA